MPRCNERPIIATRKLEESSMEGPARGCLAGLVSWKLGGGIISTILIFIIVYSLLGHC
jgi:hypothetical protein